MTVIKVDDVVSFVNKQGKMQYGIVVQIKANGEHTVRCLEKKNKHYFLTLSEMSIVARKGTKRYSMIVEGALPNIQSAARSNSNDRECAMDRIDKLLKDYRGESKDKSEVRPMDEFIKELEQVNAENFFETVINKALDENDRESFIYWSEKLSDFKNSEKVG